MVLWCEKFSLEKCPHLLTKKIINKSGCWVFVFIFEIAAVNTMDQVQYTNQLNSIFAHEVFPIDSLWPLQTGKLAFTIDWRDSKRNPLRYVEINVVVSVMEFMVWAAARTSFNSPLFSKRIDTPSLFDTLNVHFWKLKGNIGARKEKQDKNILIWIFCCRCCYCAACCYDKYWYAKRIQNGRPQTWVAPLSR